MQTLVPKYIIAFHDHRHVSSSLRRLTARVLHPCLFSSALFTFLYEPILAQLFIFFIHVSLGFPLHFFSHALSSSKTRCVPHSNPSTHVRHTPFSSFSYPFWNAFLFEFYGELHRYLHFLSNLSSKSFWYHCTKASTFFKVVLLHVQHSHP